MRSKAILFLTMLLMIFNISTASIHAMEKKPDSIRLGGDTRYETSYRIASDGWTSPGSLVIASATNFADALAGVPLAAAVYGPIMITDSKEMNPMILDYIKEKRINTVYILGGYNAISMEAEQQLDSLFIRRIQGETRYETSVKIAEVIKERTGQNPTEIFVASGYNYPDALSISPIAGIKKQPIIYSPASGKIDSVTAMYLKENKHAKVRILGGYNAVNDNVFNNIKRVGIKDIKRIYGENRYDTCIKINKEYNDIFEGNDISVATGMAFPDALAGGAYAAKKKIPVILTDNGDSYLVTSDYVVNRKPERIYAFGGQSAVTDSTIHSLFAPNESESKNSIWIVDKKAWTEEKRITFESPLDCIFTQSYQDKFGYYILCYQNGREELYHNGELVGKDVVTDEIGTLNYVTIEDMEKPDAKVLLKKYGGKLTYKNGIPQIYCWGGYEGAYYLSEVISYGSYGNNQPLPGDEDVLSGYVKEYTAIIRHPEEGHWEYI